MRGSLYGIALALSFGSGAVAQEKLSVDVTVHIQGNGDIKGKEEEWVGARGEPKRIDGMMVKKRSGPKNVDIVYRCDFWQPNDNWLSSTVHEGQNCGSNVDLRGKPITGFSVWLGGEGANNYRLTYQCDRQEKGETGLMNSAGTCGEREGPPLRAVYLKVWPAPPDRGYIDDKIAVRAWRLQQEDPPKVGFTVKLVADLSDFYVAYQRTGAAPGDQPKTTTVTTVDPANKPDHYGDHLGRDKNFNSEALDRDAEYDYWVVGHYRNDPAKAYTSGKSRFKTEPVKGLKQGILTGEASQPSPERTTATLYGAIGKPKDDGTAYVQYGTNPQKLTSKTPERGFSAGEEFLYSADIDLLQPQTKYFYQLAADYANGETASGVIMNTTTAKLTLKKENPCEGRMLPEPYYMATRLSEELAVVCSYAKLPGSGQRIYISEGQLVCPAQFPRNLNTKPLDFKIPKVDIGVSIEGKGVNFWRSSEDFRFNDPLVWAQKGEEGQQQPVRQGSQKYSATNWNRQPQTLITWIYCSSNWSQPNTFK